MYKLSPWRSTVPPHYLLLGSVSSTSPSCLRLHQAPHHRRAPCCSPSTRLLVPPPARHFLYRLTPDADVHGHPILFNLKDSLSRVLNAFYPLAGRLRLTPGTSSRYELHYLPGDGVTFNVAEHGGGVDDSIFDVLATDDPWAATLLPGLRRSLAVGVAVHHAAVDGSASTHFLHSWAAAVACTHTNSSLPPVIDRSLLPGALFHFQATPRTATTFRKVKLEMPAGQLLATFTLTRDDIQRVKDTVTTEDARHGVAPPPRCTSLVAALAASSGRVVPPVSQRGDEHHHTRGEPAGQQRRLPRDLHACASSSTTVRGNDASAQRSPWLPMQ
nr:unnamed protein product [Digitaria exilis]